MRIRLFGSLNLLCFFLAIPFNSVGQERFLKRAEEALSKGNWELAESSIRSYESKEGNKPETHYMRHWLLRMTAKEVSEFDQAKMLLEMAVQGLSTQSVKNKQEWCKDIDFCEDRFEGLRWQIDSLLFQAVKKSNKKSEVEWFLNKYPGSPNANTAKNWRVHLIFLEKKSINTEEAYSTFLSEYPNHEDAEMAKELLWGAGWEKATGLHTIAGYEMFIKKYPRATQAPEAQKRIFTIAWSAAEKADTEDEYLNFLSQYPNAPQISMGRKKAEELGWVRVNNLQTVQGYLSYAKKYPASIYKQPSLKKAESLAWEEATRSSDSRKLKQFVMDFPTSDSIRVAKTLIEERSVDVLPWLMRNRKYRLFNVNTKQFVGEMEYDFIAPASPNRFVVCRDQKKGIIDKKGSPILPSNYEEISQIGPGIFSVQLKEKTGVLNKNAEIIIPIQYEEILRTISGHFLVAKTINGQKNWGIFNQNGSQLTPFKYSQIEHLSDSLFVAGSKELVGVVGEGGSIQQPIRFQIIKRGVGKQLLVREKEKWGVIRPNGSYVIKPQFEYFESDPYEINLQNGVSSQHNFYIGRLPNEKNILLDSSGNILLTHTGSISYLGGNFFKVEPPYSSADNAGGTQIYNATKKSYVSNKRFNGVGFLGENKFWVSESGRSGYIDVNGKVVTPFIFSDEQQIPNPQSDNEAGYNHGEYEDGEYYAEVDELPSENCMLFGAGWDEPDLAYSNKGWTNPPGVFADRLAAIYIEGKVGFIDAEGKIRIQPKYEQATPFFRGVSEVVKVVKNGAEEDWVHQLIDTSGIVLVDNARVDFFYQNKALAIISNGTWGEGSQFYLFDLNTRQKKLIGSGLSTVSLENGYFKATYKDAEVYISDEGDQMMDSQVDFSHFKASELADKANGLVYEEKWDEAIQKCNEALRLRPRYIRAMMLLVTCYKAKQYHSEVVNWYNKAVSTSPADDQILSERMEYYYEKKYWSDALRDLDMLTLRDPSSSGRWFQKAYAEGELNYHDRAIISYTKVLSLDKNNSGALNNRGNAYLNKGMYAQALSDFSAGIKYVSGDDKEEMGRLYNNRGITLMRLKRGAEACLDFQKSSGYGNSSATQNIRYYCQNKK